MIPFSKITIKKMNPKRNNDVMEKTIQQTINIIMGNCQDNSVVQNVSCPSNYRGIRMACYGWKHTFNNLFDYNADDSQYSKTFLEIEKSTQIIKETQDTFTKAPLDNNAFGVMELIQKNEEQYVLAPILMASKVPSNQLWLVVKSTPSKKYKLKEGDLLRIGKMKIKVKEIILDDRQTEQIPEVKAKFKVYNSMTKQSSEGFNPIIEDKLICRICLDEGEFDNPLIAPCKCSGSARYIHLKCIQEWFAKTINPRNLNSAIIITWKPLICQLCHENLPFKLYIDGQKYFTVNIPRPKKPYIVLNPVDRSIGNAKLYYLVSFSQKNKLTMGRKKDSDIVLEGQSTISRHHTFIQLVKNQDKPSYFVISDNQSKFGTLALLKKPINLEAKHSGLSFQVAGNMLTLEHGGQYGKKPQFYEDDDINASDSESSEEMASDEEEEKKELDQVQEMQNPVTMIQPKKK